LETKECEIKSAFVVWKKCDGQKALYCPTSTNSQVKENLQVL